MTPREVAGWVVVAILFVFLLILLRHAGFDW